MKRSEYDRLIGLVERAIVRNQWNYWYDCRQYAGRFLFNGELQQFNRLLRKVEIAGHIQQPYALTDLDVFLMERTERNEKNAC